MKNLTKLFLAWVLGMLFIFSSSSTSFALLGDVNILGNSIGHPLSFSPQQLEQWNPNQSYIFLANSDQAETQQIPEWAKEIIGAEEYQEAEMTLDELKGVAKPVIVGITLNGQSDFLVVTDIYTSILTQEEMVSYIYNSPAEESMKMDDFLKLWDSDGDGKGKVYLPAGEVEVPQWAKDIIGAENFMLSKMNFEELKQAEKPILVRWPQDGDFKYTIIDDIKPNIAGKDMVYYRDESGSNVMSAETFQDLWKGDVLLPIGAKKTELPPMDFVITDFDDRSMAGPYGDDVAGDYLDSYFDDEIFPDRGNVLVLDYTAGTKNGYAFDVFVSGEKINLSKGYKYLAIDIRGVPKKGSSFPAGQLKIELKQDPSVKWYGYTQDRFGDEWTTIYIPINRVPNWIDALGFVFESHPKPGNLPESVSGIIYIDRIGFVKELPKK